MGRSSSERLERVMRGSGMCGHGVRHSRDLSRRMQASKREGHPPKCSNRTAVVNRVASTSKRGGLGK